MGKWLHRYSFYALILAVYGIFFSIESFYNFEGHSDARDIIRHSDLRSVSAEAGPRSASPSHPGTHKVKIRLNKRFHQEEFPPCTVYEVSVPCLPVIPQELGSFAVRPLPSVSVGRPRLRGPPAIA